MPSPTTFVEARKRQKGRRGNELLNLFSLLCAPYKILVFMYMRSNINPIPENNIQYGMNIVQLSSYKLALYPDLILDKPKSA